MKTWEMNVRKVVPYVPGEQPKRAGIIKLNTNENPYPPAPGVSKALQELNAAELKLYPDPTCKILVDALAEYHHLAPDQVFVGVGSDDVLALAFLTFFNSKQPIRFPDITYSFYDVWADLFRIPYECPALTDDFKIDKADYLKPSGGIVIANPNAPTGISMELAEIEEIVVNNPEVMVIVDEAYIDFGGESAESLISVYDNLLVVRTFSKSRSLAGLRIGYALGQPKVIKYLSDVKYSFNSYTMGQAVLSLGCATIADEGYFRDTIEKIKNTRERVKREMAGLGFSFADSQSNFIFATHRQYQASDLFQALQSEKIYVRYFNKPRIDNYLRITIGTDAEMDQLLDFLKLYRE